MRYQRRQSSDPACRPARGPAQAQRLEPTEEPVAEPGDGEFVVKVSYISLDPAMRGWMNEGKSYIAPVDIGEVMRAGSRGQVIASKHTGFAVGEHVVWHLGVQEYASPNGKGVTKVDPIVGAAARLISARSGCRA